MISAEANDCIKKEFGAAVSAGLTGRRSQRETVGVGKPHITTTRAPSFT